MEGLFGGGVVEGYDEAVFGVERGHGFSLARWLWAERERGHATEWSWPNSQFLGAIELNREAGFSTAAA